MITKEQIHIKTSEGIHGDRIILDARLYVGAFAELDKRYEGDREITKGIANKLVHEIFHGIYGELIEPLRELEMIACKTADLEDFQKARDLHGEIINMIKPS